jgi:RsiW-degrading membrane proteinase PrsW (M82 family)
MPTCPDCGRSVPDGEFCGACGAHLHADTGARHRYGFFAAQPHEHVLHLSVVSTLLPHLPQRRSGPFRLALLLTLVLMVALGALRLAGPSLIVASVAVPLVYLIYLYEVEVYEDEPVLVIGAILILGLVVGAVWALLTGSAVTGAVVLNADRDASRTSLVVVGVLLPLGAQALMLIGALAVYLTRKFDESLDGFTFGAAAALSFTCASTLVFLLPEMQQGPISTVPVANNVAEVVQRGLLVPVINASTTGLVAGALWFRRGRLRRHVGGAFTTSLVATVVLAVVVQAGLGLANLYLAEKTFIDVAIYAGVAVLLLFIVRIALHRMLLAEAERVEIGEPSPCTHCHRMVPRMAFCPNCGIATRATPKVGGGRHNRAAD